MLEEFDLSITTNLAKRCGSKVAFWMHDDPYELDASFRIIDFADYIFTTDKSSVLHYPPVVPAFHLPLAACPFAHYRPILKRSGPDWFFCGVPFACRQEFFLNLSLITPSLSGLLLGPGWDLGRFSQAADIGVSSAQICNYYATALSVMYLGRDFNLANAKFGVKPSTPGPRMFEAAMAGAVQLVNTPGLEVLEYFGDRNEVIMVDTPEGASSIIFSLKSDPQRSIEIGGAAQRRALSEHTYAHRAKNMIATILG
jgi:spore maturation protein CgeB